MSEAQARAMVRVGSRRAGALSLRTLALLCLASLLALPMLAWPAVRATAATPLLPLAAPPPPGETPGEPPAGLAALQGESRAFRFGHLPPAAGLSQSVVVGMLQDDQGFLWLATQDGLNRYDGSEFRIFKEDPGTPGGLRGNFCASLVKAPSGELWIGTNDGGLNRYDPQTGQFTSYLNDPQNANSLSENSVPAVRVGPDGIVWAGTNNRGLNRLDPRSGQVTRYVHDDVDPQSLSADNVSSLAVAADGAIWVGTSAGLNRLDPATGSFVRYQYNPQDPQSLSDNAVQTLYIDRQGTLWVGTFTGGLNRFDPESDSFTRYVANPSDPTSLTHNSVASVFEDRSGRFWVGTQGGGLNLLDRATGRLTHYRHDADDPGSLSNDSVMSIYQDKSGTLWFGTFGAGADYYDPYKSKFVLLRSDPRNPDGLSSNHIWSILVDSQGMLWLGTNDGGLNRLDPKLRSWQHYRHDPADPGSLGNDTVYVAYEDRKGTLWLGMPTGLGRFDRRTEDFRSYPMAPVFAIYEDRQGRFWVGTALGLTLFDRETGAGRTFRSDPGDPSSLSSDVISLILEDTEGNFWVGTLNGGLNRFDRETGRSSRLMRDPRNPRSPSSNTILTIMQARDGRLWLGTTGGLDLLDPHTGTFTACREQDGLPNDYVYAVLEDSAGRLWLSTNKGLSRFDPRTLVFRNYDEADGLQGNEFNQWAYFEDRDGVMYFGGVQGLNAFLPNQIHDSPYVPPLAITGLEIYNRPVAVEPGSPLQQPIEVSKEIRLSYTDGFFELQYAALHFSSPGQIRYAYMMEGLDKGWNDVGGRRFATYTNVPPGNYTFHVKGTNPDGVWNEEGVALRIVIPPPFWQTTWFRLLVGAGVIGAISGGFLGRIRSVEAQRRRLELQVEARTRELRETMLELARAKDASEAANRAKSVFLANMSHEFRTPLNAILGFTQLMLRDRRLLPEQMEDIEIINRSSEHLLGLINDVLEMSKIEAGRITLKPQGFDLHRMLEGLQEMFSLRAEDKGIGLELVFDPGVPRYVRGDEGKLRQVLMNLLGNAVKFTREGSVLLRVQACPAPNGEGLGLRFAVEDTGPGIAPEELNKLFVPFLQTASGQQAQQGTGLGLAISQQYVRLMGGEIGVESRPGRGSVFHFELPLETISAADLETPPSTRRVVGLEPGQPVYRLLVVDDQEVNRKLLLRIFRPLGFEVREATNGKEALEVWEAWGPHLVWMDMRMPVMDGYEATRRMKATTRGMATIVVALTASVLDEEREVILSEGSDDYVRKPFHEEELFAMLAKHLGVRFAYEDAGTETPEGVGVRKAPADEVEELASRLRCADPVWLGDLERAAILGDLGAIERLAGQVAARDLALAHGIARLAGAFDHDQILALIQQAQKGRQDGAD